MLKNLMKQSDKPSEAEKFDRVVRTLLSVSHEEIQKRDKEWRRKREKSKKAKVPKNDRR
jgi:hypothetical protein